MKGNTVLERITAGAFIVLLVVLGYYAFYPVNPVTLHSISIDKDEYCLGEYANITMHFTKHINLQAEIDWYIVDGIIFKLDSPGISRPSGENTVVVKKQIPYSLNPGVYNFRSELKYIVHPIRSPIHVAWNTPDFSVIDCQEIQ